MSEENKAPKPIPLLQILANMAGGSIVHEMQDELARVTKAVSLLGKKGKVTLVIDVAPTTVLGAISLAAELSSKVPKPKRGADLLYADMSGGLHRNDPRQMDAFSSMLPRVVGGGTVNTTTGEILDEAQA